ncbi:MAG: hypothetical protein A3K03_08070 [Bdellovibrionales bacterium RIFOXYD1_FULL_44_7]|nr:MAG: hypothetical protein A3K03_08070 [Bdellovibrionales bacterium RIFOXYD1_FULL_44_7]
MKLIQITAFVAGVLCLGLSMPSCPGQQAMQQQIDNLQTKSADNAKRIQNLEAIIKGTTNEISQIKTLLGQVSNTVLAQKQTIEQIETQLKAKAAPAKASSRPRKKGR